jgi:hypothetical protein
MITVSDIQQLLASWTERLDTSFQPSSYKDALSECIYELNQLINKTLLDEMTEEDAREYMLSQEADAYLSSEENYYATAI